MTQVTEIAPDVFRISTFIPEANLGFSQFLVRDDEPLLFHTGMRSLFPIVKDAVATLIDPSKLRWIGFSHFEADECGSLAEWRAAAPNSTPVCSIIGKLVNVDDFFPGIEAKGMTEGEILETGSRRFRFVQTPQVPHCWDAGVMFEETTGVLFCSDLVHQNGDVPAITSADIIDRCRKSVAEMQQGPLANYIPYTPQTDPTLRRLAGLKPQILATMHGSVYSGDGEKVLLDYADMLKIELGGELRNV